MVVTNLSPDDFVHETKRWGVTSSSLIRVRMMRKGKFIYCRFAVPQTDEIVQTRVSAKDFEDFEFMNLAAISVPAVWADDTDKLSKLIKQLGVLNVNS